MGQPIEAIKAAGKTASCLTEEFLGQGQIGLCVSKVTVAHIGRQQRQFGVDVGSLSIPSHEAMHGKSPAQIVEMRRAVGAALTNNLWAIDAKTLEKLTKTAACPDALKGPDLGQNQKDWSCGRDSEPALAQFEETLEIGGCPPAYGNQAVLVELGGLNK
jgi:hypothetical protein